MTNIENTWNRIEQWLRQHAPEALKQLRKPATPEMVMRAADVLGELPDDYRAWVQIHDGAKDAIDSVGFLEGYAPYSLQEVANARKKMQEVMKALPVADLDANAKPDRGIRQKWWHDKWLPIAIKAGDSFRVLVCMDLDPAPGGTRGQLVEYLGDMDKRRLVAPSFGAWLERVAASMDSGQLYAKRDPDDDELIGLRRVGEPDDDEDDDL